MKSKIFKVILGIIFLFFLRSAYSQRLTRSELGIIGGGMYYIGDLNDQQYWNIPSVSGGIIYRYTVSDRWVIKANFLYGSISQKKDGNPYRNLSFKSSVYELSAHAEFNFLPFLTNQSVFNFSPYIFCGIGAFTFNPKAKLDNTWYNLVDYRTEGQESKLYPDRKTYSLRQMSFPFGIGFKWDVDRIICLGFEWGFRKTWTDYLDDVSTTYADEDILFRDGGETAVKLADRSLDQYHDQGSRRGDPSKNDWYAFLGASLTVKIHSPQASKRKCTN